MRRRLVGAFGVLLLLVAGLVVASAFVASDLHQGVRRDIVDDALPLRRAVYDLRVQMLEEETGVLGFLVTGRQSSLRPLRGGLAGAAADLELIRSMARRHPRLRPLVAALEPRIAAVNTFFGQEIALAGSGFAGRLAAQTRVDRGTVLFDAFRASAVRVADETNRIVADAIAEQDRRYRDLLVLLGVVGGSAFLLVLALALRVPRRTVALVRAERRARERSERLEATAVALAAASSPHDVAEVIVTQGRAALSAQFALVYLLDERSNELRIAAEAGYTPGSLDRFGVQRLDTDSRLGVALRAGEPLVLESRERTLERFPHFAGLDEASAGGRASITVPLVSGRRLLGGFFLGFAVDRTFEDVEVALFETLGRQCSQALERALLLQAEHASRARAERLDEVTAALSSALTPGEIARVCLESGGDALGARRGWLGLLDPSGRRLELAGQRGYPEGLAAGWATVDMQESAPAADALRSREALYLSSPEAIVARYPALAGTIEQTGDQAWAVLPLTGGPRGLGVLLLAFDQPMELVGEERRFAREIAERCSRALERGREYELQRRAAETLQMGALPEMLPAVDGVTLAATYSAGAEALDVGGDWYDAFAVPGRGEIGLVVGDVVGKGVEAASTMARLRNALRAYALDGLAPELVLARLNDLWTRDPPTYATVALGSLDLASLALRLSVAGHPPPLLVPADGEPRFLHEPRGTPLGAVPDAVYAHRQVQLEPGDLLLLYSDGLVESHELPLDAGLERLRQVAGELRDSRSDALVNEVVTRCLAGRRQADDVVVLAVRIARLA